MFISRQPGKKRYKEIYWIVSFFLQPVSKYNFQKNHCRTCFLISSKAEGTGSHTLVERQGKLSQLNPNSGSLTDCMRSAPQGFTECLPYTNSLQKTGTHWGVVFRSNNTDITAKTQRFQSWGVEKKRNSDLLPFLFNWNTTLCKMKRCYLKEASTDSPKGPLSPSESCHHTSLDILRPLGQEACCPGDTWRKAKR